MKNSLHLTTDDKLNIVDISQALLDIIHQKESSIVGTPIDVWLDRNCLRSFLKDVLLASRGETIYDHAATLHIKNIKLHVLMDMIPTIKRNDSLASKIQFTFSLKKQPVDCNPLLKATSTS